VSLSFIYAKLLRVIMARCLEVVLKSFSNGLAWRWILRYKFQIIVFLQNYNWNICMKFNFTICDANSSCVIVTEKTIIKKATMYTQDSKFLMPIEGHWPLGLDGLTRILIQIEPMFSSEDTQLLISGIGLLQIFLFMSFIHRMRCANIAWDWFVCFQTVAIKSESSY
jgi:hypothetical protein